MRNEPKQSRWLVRATSLCKRLSLFDRKCLRCVNKNHGRCRSTVEAGYGCRYGISRFALVRSGLKKWFHKEFLHCLSILSYRRFSHRAIVPVVQLRYKSRCAITPRKRLYTRLCLFRSVPSRQGDSFFMLFLPEVEIRLVGYVEFYGKRETLVFLVSSASGE